MKVGDLVRALGFAVDYERVFLVLESRNEKGFQQVRLHCSKNPYLQQSWSNAEFFEVVNEGR